MKPLGIYMAPFAEAGVEYKSSYPTNLYERIRLFIAQYLIKWGNKLLLKNGSEKIETGSSNKTYHMVNGLLLSPSFYDWLSGRSMKEFKQ